MQLSKNFSLQEFVVSQTAERKGINNIPDILTVDNLTKLAAVLEQVRALLGRPIYISSGYRCPELNEAVGSKPTSAHIKGLAADFSCPGFGSTTEIFMKLKDSGLEFDQLISEFADSPSGGWVHIGIKEKKADYRRECLIITRNSTRKVS